MNDLTDRLADAVRLRTISPADGDRDREAFRRFHEFLGEAFPLVHQALRREVVGDLSLLYTWEGRDPTRSPILLSAHIDVVPVAPGTAWTYPPFDGVLADGCVWGRGTLDDKAAVLGILEAVERLLGDGVRPARTIYLAFGHDEELGGAEGAAAIAALLRARGVVLDYVLDEGLVIGDGLLEGVDRPVAFLGVAEKGRVVLELVARAPAGHASMPPAYTAPTALAAALHRMDRHPMPATLGRPMREMLAVVAPRMPWVRRFVLSRPRLFAPLIRRQLTRVRTTNAMIRTTMAVTVIAAGSKDNVLPSEAHARIDVRVLPGDDVDAVVEHVRIAVDDPGVEIRTVTVTDPSPVSPTDGAGYRTLEAAVASVFPGTLVAPGLLVGGTDAKHYVPISGAAYRFRPIRFTPDDVSRIHGVDERIRIDDYARLVEFYAAVLQIDATNARPGVSVGRGGRRTR